MFILSTASSSRVPLFLGVSTQQVGRSFCSSPIVSVKRPQKPYEAPIAKIDAYGNRVPIDFDAPTGKSGKEENERLKFLEGLYEQKNKSVFEKYGNGNSNEFGIRRNKSRSSISYPPSRSTSEIHSSSSYPNIHDGKDDSSLGEEEWKEKIGMDHRARFAKNKFKRADEMFREQAKRMNPSFRDGDERRPNQSRNRDSSGGTSNSNNKRNFGMRNNKVSFDTGLGTSSRSESDFGSEENTDRYKGRSGRSTFQFNTDKNSSQSPYSSKSDIRTERGTNSSLSNQPRYRQSFGSSPASDRSNNNHNLSPNSSPSQVGAADISPPPSSSKSPDEYWKPTKKLTYSAMAGMKALYSLDPVKFSKEVLSKKFGISREAVTRILKSKYRKDGQGEIQGQGEIGLKGTKWDRNPSTAETVSPVPAILRAFGKDP
ncbi:uncharacterized protein IL334_000231 [Kwoniella shivajii]|uniref:Required for respiratory growth protein 9, mitochondrial n=1 Tax=Kwoniella shivajii TaxID=564305 RepID=A0ABZ1CNK4_9TREE|nr:hypothetical protein IL334_000231 [Kwoniella shivajii]